MPAPACLRGGPETTLLNNPPSSLPVCPAPQPQEQSDPTTLPFNDPSVPHCQMIPSVAGIQLPGINENAFLSLTPTLTASIAAADAGVQTDPQGPVPASNQGCLSDYGGTSCQNGIIMDSANNWRGLQAALQAQKATLYGVAEVYNWIGEENNVASGQLDQVGINYGNFAGEGVGNQCSNYVNYRDFVMGQVDLSGRYEVPICATSPKPSAPGAAAGLTGWVGLWLLGFWLAWLGVCVGLG